jgi:RNA polymerase sigma-70 factor, ECF subfamily
MDALTSADEQELIDKCQSGNTEAFGVLYDRHIRTIYNFIFYKTFDKEVSEDLTSQTFFKALKNINSLHKGKPILPWLYTIARNTVIDHFRARKQTEAIDDGGDIADDSSRGAEEDFHVSEQVRELKKHLAALSELERDIVIMRVWQELPYKEIAEVVGKSEGNCKVIYSRTLEKLRALMPMTMALLFIMKQ